MDGWVLDQISKLTITLVLYCPSIASTNIVVGFESSSSVTQGSGQLQLYDNRSRKA